MEPFAPWDAPAEFFRKKNGADGRDRTCDLLVTNELLYQLSYIGTPLPQCHYGKAVSTQYQLIIAILLYHICAIIVITKE